MTIFLVRHAHAQSRGAWEGDDEGRPLTKRGRRQTDALVAAIGDRPIRRILSSPSLRCLDTMRPLAEKVDVELEVDPGLAEAADPATVLARARALAQEDDGDVVLCTHGDVMPEVLRLLASSDGTTFTHELRWAKGSAWALTATGDRFTTADYLSPAEN